MATPQSFRSAFNGFNREDVVHYLEYLNAKHASQLDQLNNEVAFLRRKLEEQPETDPAAGEEMTRRIGELEEKLAESVQERETLSQKVSQLEKELDQSRAERVTVQHQADQELEAYRRAERTERMARERAEQVYRQTNGVLADASAKVDEAAGQVSEISDHVMSQLDLLREAVSCSKQALADAAAGLYSLKPREE